MHVHSEDIIWFKQFCSSPNYERFQDRPIAYFSSEFCLKEKIPTYAGGLGILAGDVMKEAAERLFPLIGIGLYYRFGYSKSDPLSPEDAGLEQVMNAEHSAPLTVGVPIGDRTVCARAWRYADRGAYVYLLDTDCEQNAPDDQAISHILYVDDKETRLKQQMVLGIGGLRLLEKLHIHPSLYHLNEGHSALLSFELIAHEMRERGLSFDEAIQFARRRIVFTNHTLVPAGQETYNNDMASALFSRYAEEIGVPVVDIIRLGLVQESSIFSMTMLSLRMANVVNAVSKLHAQKAQSIWTDHPMVSITNGVSISRWDTVSDIDKTRGSFWNAHKKEKKKLIEYVKEHRTCAWEESDLICGWARRIVSYKRPLALFEEVERLKKIAIKFPGKIRFCIAGKAHPADTIGLEDMKRLSEIANKEISDLVLFFPEYDASVAQVLIPGCDVWLNTPIVGFEACGTSGMKAALNGVLPCTTDDGWMHQVDVSGWGWKIANERVGNGICDVLENEIAPLFWRRERSVPADWEDAMHKARETVLNRFSATRMLREYIETLYI